LRPIILEGQKSVAKLLCPPPAFTIILLKLCDDRYEYFLRVIITDFDMFKALPDEVWEQRKTELQEWLTQNPDSSTNDAISAGYRPALSYFYKGRINEAKKEIGIETRRRGHTKTKLGYSSEFWESELDDFHRWLIANPDAGVRQVRIAGYGYVLEKFYDWRLNDARVVVELHEKQRNPQDEIRYINALPESVWQERRIELYEILLDQPDISRSSMNREARMALKKYYKDAINRAREDLGLLPFNRGRQKNSVFWRREKARFIGWLENNPDAYSSDVRNAGFRHVLVKFYGDSLNKAKEDIGLDPRLTGKPYPISHWEEMLIHFQEYLSSHPDSTFDEIIEDSTNERVLETMYGKRLRDAKRELSIPIVRSNVKKHRSSRTPRQIEYQNLRFKHWLLRNPQKTNADSQKMGFGPVLMKLHNNRINDAKKAFGIEVKHRGPVGVGSNGYSHEEWWEKRMDLIEWMWNNPMARAQDIRSSPHQYTFKKIYSHLEDLRDDAGLPEGRRQMKFEQEMEIVDPIDISVMTEQAEMESAFHRMNLRLFIDNLFEILNEREIRVLEDRIYRGYTLQEIADDMNITRERVRQIQLKAFHKARIGLNTSVVKFNY